MSALSRRKAADPTMDVQLIRATPDDAGRIQALLHESFAGLLEKYQDHDTNPGAMTVEAVRLRLEQTQTYYYLIVSSVGTLGAIRVVDWKDGETRKRIAPLYVLPAYRNRGVAQRAMALAEDIHGAEHWMLDTILQEKGNCYLYEKMGYHQTGHTEAINDRMTLVFYEKD